VTLEPIGGIADVSLTEQVIQKFPSQAQMLARVGHPAARIEDESGVSASTGQMLARREGRTR